MIEFEGSIGLMEGGPVIRPVLGWYEWIDQLTPEPRVRGMILARHQNGRNTTSPRMLADDRAIDLHARFSQASFSGRPVRLEIPGVGISPVRLRSPGVWSDIEFEAWAPPIPDLSDREVIDGLWTACHDALQESGYPDLAMLCRAACVRIEGFQPDPSRVKRGVPDLMF